MMRPKESGQGTNSIFWMHNVYQIFVRLGANLGKFWGPSDKVREMIIPIFPLSVLQTTVPRPEVEDASACWSILAEGAKQWGRFLEEMAGA